MNCSVMSGRGKPCASQLSLKPSLVRHMLRAGDAWNDRISGSAARQGQRMSDWHGKGAAAAPGGDEEEQSAIRAYPKRAAPGLTLHDEGERDGVGPAVGPGLEGIVADVGERGRADPGQHLALVEQRHVDPVAAGVGQRAGRRVQDLLVCKRRRLGREA